MIYEIKGRHKYREVVEEYLDNLLKCLKLHRLTKNSLVIEFIEILEDGTILGQCVGDKNKLTVQIARTAHTGKLSFLEQMFSLSHEMVHVKQYFRQELTINENGEWIWKNRKSNGYKYDNQPWEREASRLESDLFMQCFPFNRI